MRHEDLQLDWVLSKSQSGEYLTRREIRFLLGLRDQGDLGRLFQTAREVRRRHFGEAIFLYGFVYFSTWCRNDCIFCRYRKSNPLAQRYRKDEREIVEIACRLADSGVHLIDLTMGEDSFYHSHNQGVNGLVDLAKAVKAQTGLPVMVSPGIVNHETLRALWGAGVEWYACYQETHNRRLFSRLRPGQSYNERLSRKVEARRLGMLIEEGILTGAGDSLDDIVTSIGVMKTLKAHQMRVMTFQAQRGTPLETARARSSRRELLTIATLRLLFPDRLIPASLDVRGISGLRDRLFAGANVVTSLIPPKMGLVGVSQSDLDIDEGYRTVKGVVPVIKETGLRVATRTDYTRWVDQELTQTTDASP